MDTKFAPAERKNWDIIKKEFNDIKSVAYIQDLINALPYVATVLNEKRQIVFTNENLLKILGIKSIEDILGTRPGEALNCIHSNKEIGGCGTSENCRFCGAVTSIIKSQSLKAKIVDECRITSKHNDEIISYDFQVSATPFEWLNQEFTIFTILDISSEKRRRALERIFFHDVINKTGGLSGFLEIIKNVEDKERIMEITSMMEEITHDLNEEIIAQRQLLEAENNELKVNATQCDTLEIINSVVIQMKHHQVSVDKNIVVDTISQQVNFTTDAILLKRVLTNMVKNALEAISEGQDITIGSQLINDKVNFWVKNENIIPDNDQLQIFQRSFSTKGISRGLGTYSMKLIGEKYLKGKVSFISNDKTKTIFMIDLPISFE